MWLEGGKEWIATVFFCFGGDGVPLGLDVSAQCFCVKGGICMFMSEGVFWGVRGGMAWMCVLRLEVGRGVDTRG